MSASPIICLRCGRQAPMEAAACTNCGHVFQRQIKPPSEEKIALVGAAPIGAAPPQSARSHLFLPMRVLLSFIGGLLVYGAASYATLGGRDQPHAERGALGRAGNADGQNHNAENPNDANSDISILRNNIVQGMSLEDVLDNSEGSGKVVGGGWPKNWMYMEFTALDATAMILFRYHGMTAKEIDSKTVHRPIWVVERVTFQAK